MSNKENVDKEIPFPIPKNWVWIELDKIGKVNPRNNILNEELQVSFVPMASVDEQEGEYLKTEVKTWGEVKKGYTHMADNDVIFAKITPCMENGKAAVLQGLINGYGAGSTEFHTFRTIGITFPKFIFHYFRSDEFRKNAKENMTGSAGQKRVPTNWFKKVLVPLPPLDEQKRVVAKLEWAFVLLNEVEDKIVKIKELLPKRYNSLLQKAFHGELFDNSTGSSDQYINHIKRTKLELIQQKKIKTSATDSTVLSEEIPFDLPEGWKWKRLIDITEKLGAGSTPKGGQKVYQESGVKFIRSQNVWNEGLKTENIAFISEEINNKMKNSIVEPKDVLLNITGASIGRCCIVPSEFDIGNVNQHVCIIRLIDKDFGEFLHKWMVSKYVQERIMSVQAGVSREGLSIGNLSNFLVPIPPISVQKKIVKRLNYEVAIHEKTLTDIVKIENKIKQMRKSLFQKAFRGELVEQHPEEGTGQELLDSILHRK